MKYTAYPSLISQISKAAFKMLPTKSMREKMGITGALRSVVPYHPAIFELMDGGILMDEWHWLNNGRHIIFPENIDTLEGIERGKFRIEAANGIIPPYQSFVINMPKGYFVAGFQCPSILVSVWTIEDRRDNFAKPLIKMLGMDRMVNCDDITTGFAREDRVLCLTYAADGIGPNGNILMARCVSDWSTLTHLLQAKNGAEYREILGNFPDVERAHAVFSLTDQENEQQFLLVKMVVKMMIYMQATNALKPGFPAQVSDDVTPQYWNVKSAPPKASVFKLNHSKQVTHRQEHYRSFFIRQLRSDRFYKGEYSAMEKGSRFVFVKDTFVGADVDAETLVNTN